jgi:hypothetical protein
MNWAWLHGRISDEQLRHEHRGEWEELVAVEASVTSETAEASEGAGARAPVSDRAPDDETKGKASEPPGAPA